MFKNDFQVWIIDFHLLFIDAFEMNNVFFIKGGHFFEIFNPAVKDPLSNCKLTGPHGIQKVRLFQVI